MKTREHKIDMYWNNNTDRKKISYLQTCYFAESVALITDVWNEKKNTYTYKYKLIYLQSCISIDYRDKQNYW